MELDEKLEFNKLVNIADRFTHNAEQMYLSGKIAIAVRDYYHASTLYEQAKMFADKCLDINKKLFAGEKEHYCLEKLDEIKRFKNICVEEVIR